MEPLDPQSTIRPRFFDPDMAEVASFQERSKIYESHLKKVRVILWVALFVFSILFYWFGENGRYVHAKDLLVLDTKTGQIFTYQGEKLE